MSEQKNGFGSMDFGTENNLKALFGSFSTPPMDLGDTETQAVTEAAETTSNTKHEIVTEMPQAEEPVPQAPVQMPQTQPEAATTSEKPEDPAPQSAQMAGQVIDLFCAVAADGADALLAKLASMPPVADCDFLRPAGPYFPASPGQIKRPA